MKNKNLVNLRNFILYVFLVFSESILSTYYKKCKLFQSHNGRQISLLLIQKVPIYQEQYYINPLIETRKKIQYKEIQYIYHQYIGSGGSGEVYLVQDFQKKELKIFKRFFKQKIPQFEQQNYIMEKMKYNVQWIKDIQNGIPKKTNYLKYNHNHKQMPTIAIYPSKQSISLRDIEFFEDEAPIIFYKILLEIEKTHRNSIIHNDLKMGNILINELGKNFKFFDAQLIDWNLASFYYIGTQSNARKGTLCYYSPQQMLRSVHITPAIDVWALAIVMFSFFTETKPFYFDCKQNNLKAIVSLVGIQKIIQIQKKYSYPIQNQYYDLLQESVQKKQIFKGKSIRSKIPKQKIQFFQEDLIDVFQKMLIVDPEQRITVTQLLNHPYFQKIKKIPKIYEKKSQSQENKKNKKQDIQKQEKKILKQDNNNG